MCCVCECYVLHLSCHPYVSPSYVMYVVCVMCGVLCCHHHISLVCHRTSLSFDVSPLPLVYEVVVVVTAKAVDTGVGT